MTLSFIIHQRSSHYRAKVDETVNERFVLLLCTIFGKLQVSKVDRKKSVCDFSVQFPSETVFTVRVL